MFGTVTVVREDDDTKFAWERRGRSINFIISACNRYTAAAPQKYGDL